MGVSTPDVKSLFGKAVEIASSAEREAYLDKACGDDTAVRAEVAALLRALDNAGPFMQQPAALQSGIIVPPTLTERPGMTIGPYRLLEELGAGGMGLVFVAEQRQPVRRTVALKVVKPGMDTREVLARFEAERQALALMDHPNIAKVLDAGSTDSGRPYFVMELVHGMPITKFCAENGLTARQKLELMIPVCRAVQHAHQKGIIHRDLTPNNILVAPHDPPSPPLPKGGQGGVLAKGGNGGVPKVIDFGIAKAIGEPLTDKTVYTRVSHMMGTPMYMSPEQAGLDTPDIDTRSDIYSLGVLLYELLTGTTPFDRQRLHEAGHDEIRRIICEEEPSKPSTRISTCETLPTSPAERRTELVRLSKQLRGDLDWIVMKCLEKDRARRYDTAHALAADLEHFLSDEPVLAGPPSAVYRLRKFVRRNRGPVLAACLVLVALVGGMVGTTIGLVEAREGRTAALQAEKAEREQRQAALENLQKARDAAAAEQRAKAAAEASEADSLAALGFLERILFGYRYLVVGSWETTTLRQAIEAAAPAVDKEFAKQPLVEARLRRTLGLSFSLMGENKKATEQLEKSLALYATHRGQDHPETLYTMTTLAKTFSLLKRNAEAARLRESALALQKGKLAADHPQILENMDNLAQVYFQLGCDLDAVAVIDECVRLGAAQSQDRLMFVRLSRLLDLRLRHFEKAKDCAGCRGTAEMWEKLKHGDANSLYNTARCRAVTAAVLRDTDKSEKGLQAAAREADQAMASLEQAVARGFSGVGALKLSPDLHVLHDREDFKRLVAELEARQADQKKSPKQLIPGMIQPPIR